jgi:hypothetical protein
MCSSILITMPSWQKSQRLKQKSLALSDSSQTPSRGQTVSDEKQGRLPTSLTPYALGSGVLVLIALVGLWTGIQSSIPWANKAEIASLQLQFRSEIEWLKTQQSQLQRYDEGAEVDRRDRGAILAITKAKLEEIERRLIRIEERVYNRPGPGN